MLEARCDIIRAKTCVAYIRCLRTAAIFNEMLIGEGLNCLGSLRIEGTDPERLAARLCLSLDDLVAFLLAGAQLNVLRVAVVLVELPDVHGG